MGRPTDPAKQNARAKVAKAISTSRSKTYNAGFMDGAQTGYSAGYDQGYADKAAGKEHRSERKARVTKD